MTRSILAGATLLLAIGASPEAMAQYGSSGDSVVRCESTNDRQQFCQVDVYGGVRLQRQLSEARCIEGQSWGSDRRGIWVDRGCRAEFLVQGAGYSSGRPGYGNGSGNGNGNAYGDAYGNAATFRCESTEGRSRQCQTDPRRVELVRQLSDRACVRGRTWGTDAQGVWVSGGCRAEFRARGQGAGYGNAQPQIVRCESADNRRQMCAANVRGGVRVVRQLSRTACVEGTSWGRMRDGIWVDRGCRAEFETGFNRNNGRFGN